MPQHNARTTLSYLPLSHAPSPDMADRPGMCISPVITHSRAHMHFTIAITGETCLRQRRCRVGEALHGEEYPTNP